MERLRPQAHLQFREGSLYTGCPVEDAPILIGGRHGNIRAPGATVSRQQARIYRAEGRVWIEDLGGDGVWVNGLKVERAPLANRDQIQVGRLELQFWEG
jgi:pSer/pThr/pTyr-binding forkhead associated (FHA) protein